MFKSHLPHQKINRLFRRFFFYIKRFSVFMFLKIIMISGKNNHIIQKTTTKTTTKLTRN